ncbi:hypothetical protein BCR32DRAFT_329550 [Anaeromyces robustus]|uniref:Uncharacterized protein n=1 Tax=Anaeromyces robustus TaxID=1754192 RepID=A0A1Y1WR64_9FUNG|nr:hypothetical protein BCR32DRAFT_329550 [Anaeromyces robustus]|eukprot:ORX76010.1 hypothetical protein BCR32DRAFT_329550 [Anaeromyces robustus]
MFIEYDDILSSIGYIVFGILSIIAILYMVKFSMEIDDERYKQQLIANKDNRNVYTSPRSNNTNNMTMRFSPKVNGYNNIDTSFSSYSSSQQDFRTLQLPYGVNTIPGSPSGSQTNITIPARKITAPAPTSPGNFHGNYMPTNNFRNSVSYNNRQSRQYLLQNNY